jgi:glycosyltransferase involved in cell wall biosynthesis
MASPGETRTVGGVRVTVLAQRKNPLLGPRGELKRLLGAVPPDTVAHVHTCFSVLTECAMRVLGARGIPFVFTPHGKLSPEFLRQRRWLKMLWWHAVAGRRVRRADVLALSSRAESRRFADLGLDGEFEVVPNGYERPDPHASSSIPRESLPERYVMFLGYLDPRKQPELAVRAFAQSRTRGTHSLVLVGPDKYEHRALVEREIAACGLDGRAVLWGGAFGADKWRLMAGADCLVLPSLAEGYPVVLNEAAGAGLPSIVSCACNASELAEQGAALELDTFDPQAWANAIDRVCQEPSRRSAMRRAAEKCRDSLTWTAVVSRWLELYRRAGADCPA